MDGFFKNSTNMTCDACGTGAKTCTSSTKALTCMDGYGLSGDSCVACGCGL
jgi:hypothetical protein